MLQNMEVLQKMGKFSGITSELAIRENLLAYKRAPVTAQVVIGTPGTINNWILSKKLGTSCLNILLFDEADHMLAESSSTETARFVVLISYSGKSEVVNLIAKSNELEVLI
ncbi:DEAD-box ATP-dependent RNA helicase 38 [Tanacetum coccineum]